MSNAIVHDWISGGPAPGVTATPNSRRDREDQLLAELFDLQRRTAELLRELARLTKE